MIYVKYNEESVEKLVIKIRVVSDDLKTTTT